MNRKPRVYVEGAGTSTYVIGTNDAREACRALHISPETHRWGSTHFGPFVRRQGHWRQASRGFSGQFPKDAQMGVHFYGRIQAKTPAE